MRTKLWLFATLILSKRRVILVACVMLFAYHLWISVYLKMAIFAINFLSITHFFAIRLADCTTLGCINSSVNIRTIYHIEHICLCSTCAKGVVGAESSTSMNEFWKTEWRRSFRLSNYFMFCPCTKLVWLLTKMQVITKCMHVIAPCCLDVVSSSDINRLRVGPAKIFLDITGNIV